MGHDVIETNAQLDALLAGENTPLLDLEGGKFVIFSDVHLGDGSAADDFNRNEAALMAALQYYKENDFHLILLGDIEELWQFDFGVIEKRYSDTVYRRMKDFGDHRISRIFGNHDLDWKIREDPVRTEQIPYAYVSEALKLGGKSKKPVFFLVHGHQGDRASDRYSWSSKFFVRCYKPLERILRKLKIIEHPTAAKSQTTGGFEKIYYDWAKKNGISIICGHSHQAVFQSKSYIQRCNERMADLQQRLNQEDGARADEIKGEISRLKSEIKEDRARNMNINELDVPHELLPCYYNTGCALYRDGITCLEIADNKIKLVKWERERGKTPGHRVYEEGQYALSKP